MNFNPTHICISQLKNIKKDEYYVIAEEPVLHYTGDLLYRYFGESDIGYKTDNFLSESFIKENFRKLTDLEKIAFKYNV